jgi:citrate synthase
MKSLLAAMLWDAQPGKSPKRGLGFARNIAETWSEEPNQLIPLIEAALILCADHELNASAFAVRVAASTDSTLPAALMAGMVTLSGMKHGGAVFDALSLFRRLENVENPIELIERMIEEKQYIPSFGHPLYPIGDPRAYLLLEMMRSTKADSGMIALAEMIRETVFDQLGLYPNIDFALAALQRAFDLPPQSGIGLFALGRATGWIAHAWEQSDAKTMIRPRAQYVGEKPVLP